MVINVYEQYFSAECAFNGVARRAARSPMLTQQTNLKSPRSMTWTSLPRGGRRRP